MIIKNISIKFNPNSEFKENRFKEKSLWVL
jgi:hypothetical protein